jgi:hypothetical protein
VANLKKQSQFLPAGIDVKSYLKEDYEELYAFEAAKKQSQSKPNLNLPQRTMGSRSKKEFV